jgi:hypothetical protein
LFNNGSQQLVKEVPISTQIRNKKRKQLIKQEQILLKEIQMKQEEIDRKVKEEDIKR